MFEEPSALKCTLGSVRGAVIVGYGYPIRARSRKRPIQPREFLRADHGFPYSATHRGPLRGPSRIRVYGHDSAWLNRHMPLTPGSIYPAAFWRDYVAF